MWKQVSVIAWIAMRLQTKNNDILPTIALFIFVSFTLNGLRNHQHQWFLMGGQLATALRFFGLWLIGPIWPEGFFPLFFCDTKCSRIYVPALTATTHTERYIWICDSGHACCIAIHLIISGSTHNVLKDIRKKIKTETLSLLRYS